MARDMWECEKCGNRWFAEPTWNYLPSWTPGIHGIRSVCGGKIVKRPAAVKGTAGKSRTATPTTTQIHDSQYQVQGSGAKPYIVDLKGHDDDISGTTHTCTCVNWKITRNSLKSSDGAFRGYDCKHIKQVLAAQGIPTATGISDAKAKALKDEIFDTFVKKAPVTLSEDELRRH